MNGVRWGKVLLIPMVALWGLGAQCGGTGTGPEITTVRLTPTFIYTRDKAPVKQQLPPGISEIGSFCLSLNTLDLANARCWFEGLVKTGENQWTLKTNEQFTFETDFYSYIGVNDAKMCEDFSITCSCMEGNIKVIFAELDWTVESEIVNNVSCTTPNSILKFKVRMK